MKYSIWILIITSVTTSILLIYTIFNPIKQIQPEQKQVDCKYTDLDRIEDYLVEGKIKIKRIYISCNKSFRVTNIGNIDCYSTIEINDGNDTKKVIDLIDDNFKGIIRKVVNKLNIEIP